MVWQGGIIVTDTPEIKFKRFAYIPIGGKFFVGNGGTVEFQKINEDEALAEGYKYRFQLDHRCRIEGLTKGDHRE